MDVVKQIEELVALARAENWSEVDARILAVCNNSPVQGWAYAALESDEHNLRDLAASILEKAQQWEFRVSELVRTALQNEQHPYAKFRMACALAAHGYKSDTVVLTLKEAPKDVQEIAKRYLSS